MCAVLKHRFNERWKIWWNDGKFDGKNTYLTTIPPTSVDSEGAFSVAGSFVALRFYFIS